MSSVIAHVSFLERSAKLCPRLSGSGRSLFENLRDGGSGLPTLFLCLRNPLDIALAKRELGWAPTIYLEEGIARLAHWLLENKPRLHM